MPQMSQQEPGGHAREPGSVAAGNRAQTFPAYGIRSRRASAAKSTCLVINVTVLICKKSASDTKDGAGAKGSSRSDKFPDRDGSESGDCREAQH